MFKREADCYTLFDPKTRYTYRFEWVAGGFLSYQLVRISDEQGHHIQLNYDRCGFLTGIIDSAGRQTENALLKLLYLRITELYKKWNGRPKSNWALVQNQLCMDDRLRERILKYEQLI